MKILITGTSRGIGKGIAEKFLKEGHEVIGIDVLDSTIISPNYTHYKKDIRDENLPNLENLDILINNAGTQDDELTISTNLIGTINLTEFYLKNNTFKSILFIASASSRNGAEFPKYSASKGGEVTYMKNLAGRVAKFGTTCNSISPGGVITESNSHILNSDKLYKEVLNETLLNKWAEVEEIADLSYFLTVNNKSITGEDILIDNGEMLKSNFVW